MTTIRLHRLALTLILTILAMPLQAQDASGVKPNILILLGDNWAAPHASILGDASVNTPTFDQIAKNGVLFTNAFCQVPSCSPSRAVLLTGKYAHQLEDAANLWGHFPDELWTFPLALQRSKDAYQVGYMIKGWGPGYYLGERHTKANPNPAGVKSESFEAFLSFVSGLVRTIPIDPGKLTRRIIRDSMKSKLKCRAICQIILPCDRKS